MTGYGQQSSFYVVGGTLARDAPSYVQREADLDLYRFLSGGDFCYVLTSRQMGKSSLMVRTAVRLREEGAAVAVVDLTAIGQNLAPEQWYDGLLARVGQQLDLEDELEDFWLDNERVAPLQRWMRAIREVVLETIDKRVVIFIDEIDAVRSLPFSTDEFFAAIRELYNRRTEDSELLRVTFCLLGVATPGDLIRDTRTTPFNIGRRIELSDFIEDDAKQLSQGLGKNGTTGLELASRALYWTGGHPYLTQRLCRAIAEDESVKTKADVDRLCKSMFLSTSARQQDDNLLFVRDRMVRGRTDVATVLDSYGNVRSGKRVIDDETSPIVNHLRLAGIVRVQDGYLKVRNRIYENVFDKEWIISNMPDAELRRQRAAFRRGLIQAASVGAVIVIIMAALLVFAYRERNRAINEEKANRRLQYLANISRAQQAWEMANTKRLLDLLGNHTSPKPGQEDFRGFEWYYLWHLSHSELFTMDHDGWIYATIFSPDGKTVATGSVDGTVKLWDVASRKEKSRFNRKSCSVTSISFTPDGRPLALINSSGVIELWDVTSNERLKVFRGHEGDVEITVLSPDGRTLLSGSKDKTARLWDVATGRELFALLGHQDAVETAVFSPDGRLVATGSYDHDVRIWDVLSGRELATLKGVRSESLAKSFPPIAFSPDGKTLASGSPDSRIRLWDVATWTELEALEGHEGAVESLVFSPDGRRLASGGQDKTIRIWDVSLHEELVLLGDHNDWVESVAFSPDGNLLASGSDDNTAKLWDVSAGRGLGILRGHTDWVESVAFSPDGNELASASDDQSIKIWEKRSGGVLNTLNGHQGKVLSVVFSPDGKLIASGSDDKTARVWQVADGQCLKILNTENAEILCVRFSPDGRLLAAGGSDGFLRLWDVATGGSIASISAHGDRIYCLAFSPDGRIIATASADETVKLWDAASGKDIGTFSGNGEDFLSVAFSPDGSTLAAGSKDRTIRIWRVAGRQEIARLEGHANGIGSLVYSPDGKRLASGSYDRSVKLWDTTTWQDIMTIRDAWGGRSVAFSKSGDTLATGGLDNTIRLWRASTKEEAAAILNQIPPDVEQ